MEKNRAFAISAILLSFAIGIYLYPSMPDEMASHWNAAGDVNGYMPKLWGVFLMPVLSAGMFFLFLLVPKIDPMKANIAKFRTHYDNFIALIIGFMFYVHILLLYWNTGARFDLAQYMVPAMGALFYFLGGLIENAKQNWFIGIRTPWTMSSERVWDKTHKRGGKLFRISGIVALLGLFFGRHALWFSVAPVILVSVYAVAYSYFEWKKERT